MKEELYSICFMCSIRCPIRATLENAQVTLLEAKGGCFFEKGPGEVRGKPAHKLNEQKFPKIEVPRFDKVRTNDFPLPDPKHGLGQILPLTILNEDPRPPPDHALGFFSLSL